MQQCYPKLSHMKSKQTLRGIALMAFAFTLFLAACNKNTSLENAKGQQQFSVFLTDGPGLFDNVFIDIQAVKVVVDTSKDTRRHDRCDWDSIGKHDRRKPDSASLVWQSLNITPGVYDVLKLRNGLDTLLATASIPAGTVRLIKIELGTRNSLVKDSVTYPLNFLPGAPNFILIKLRGGEPEQLSAGSSRLWLDFDVGKSIIRMVNGQFYLKPFLSQFVPSKYAGVKGKVEPSDAKAIVSVFNNTDTAYAIPNRDGYFKVRGLKDGTYTVFVNGSNGYGDTTITNVVVARPAETNLGTITLKK